MERVRAVGDRARSRLDRLAERPVIGPTVRVLRKMVVEFRDDRITGLAAEVAFFAVLSLFPLLVAVAAAVGSIEAAAGADAADRARDAIVDALQEALGGEASGVVSTVDQLFAESNTGLLGLGLIISLYTASRGFAALIRALDQVYDIPETRSWLRTRATAYAMVAGSVLFGAVVLTMFVVGPLFGRGEDLADELGLGSAFVTFWVWVRPPLLAVVSIVWAATVFHVGPNHTTPWRADLPGAVLTTVLWGLGAVGFRAYLEVAAGGSNVVLGTLGGAVILLLWLYVMGLALLVGAELNSSLRQLGRGAQAEAAAEEDERRALAPERETSP
ncbi:MAG TPA: YhjD/YihY/BrkB family envelope integrity protein [Acidimicrobiales bacterium]|nr:YhjD/YihY/BrkB family envelope integrity protein [Acidimicrobiales bacterium]